MSNSILPSFPGLTWNITRKPVWSTVIKTSASGREFRTSLWSSPRWQYKLSYEVLRARTALPEVQQLMGFFNLHKGSEDSWLYTDPDDNTATARVIGVGTGLYTDFQLTRSFGGHVQPVTDPNVVAVYLNGVLTTNYTLLSNGVVHFCLPQGQGWRLPGQGLSTGGAVLWRTYWISINSCASFGTCAHWNL